MKDVIKKPCKKPWKKPELKRIAAGSAEASTNPGNDGQGGQTGS